MCECVREGEGDECLVTQCCERMQISMNKALKVAQDWTTFKAGQRI